MPSYLTAYAVAQMICAARDKAGGVRKLAKLWKVTPSHISDLCHGRRGPGPELAKKIGVRVEHIRLTQYRVEGS